MSDRYSKLFSLHPNLYIEKSPVIISAGALLKDNQNGNVLVQLKIKNILDKRIKVAKVRIQEMDSINKPIGNPIEYEYLDLFVSRDQEFGQKVAISVSNSSTRAFSVSVFEVDFEDNSSWVDEDSIWEPLPEQEVFHDHEMLKQYQTHYGTSAQYKAEKYKDVWLCACGKVNHEQELTCHNCNNELNELLSCNWEALREEKEERLAQEQAKREADAEAAQIAKEEKKEKQKNWIKKGIIVAGIIVVIGLVIGLIIGLINNNKKSNFKENIAGCKFISTYESAKQGFTAMDFKDDETVNFITADDVTADSISSGTNAPWSIEDVSFNEITLLLNNEKNQEYKVKLDSSGMPETITGENKDKSITYTWERVSDDEYSQAIGELQELAKQNRMLGDAVKNSTFVGLAELKPSLDFQSKMKYVYADDPYHLKDVGKFLGNWTIVSGDDRLLEMIYAGKYGVKIPDVGVRNMEIKMHQKLDSIYVFNHDNVINGMESRQGYTITVGGDGTLTGKPTKDSKDTYIFKLKDENTLLVEKRTDGKTKSSVEYTRVN